ncbi:MAG: PASTA domain-containing protein [Methanosarcinaceae archaeon]|nr:PASTA domain-containing protein [Methanosarcinaceae archaeon]MDD4498176.1 PASTA domain-containing protein [Methanosarcinaceae archaeon]
MKAKLEQRLEELKAEYESGRKIQNDIENTLKELQNRKENLEETLLRISGAIELLEELLDRPSGRESCVADMVDMVGGEKEGPALKATEEVEVPKVVRQPLEQATKMLEDVGLQVGKISEKPIFVAGVHFGAVIKQDPKPGEKADSGTAVDLVLAAKGKFKPDLSKNSRLRTFCTH